MLFDVRCSWFLVRCLLCAVRCLLVVVVVFWLVGSGVLLFAVCCSL